MLLTSGGSGSIVLMHRHTGRCNQGKEKSYDQVLPELFVTARHNNFLRFNHIAFSSIGGAGVTGSVSIGGVLT